MSDTTNPEKTGLPIGKLLLAALALGALIAFGRSLGGQIPAFTEWVDGLGVWGPVVFILGYAVAVVGFVPASLLTLAAGAVFGLLWGTVYVFIAASAGACMAFLVARYLAGAAVQKRIDGDARFAAIDRAVAEQGRRIVFLLRLSPAFPFNLLNYALGLTRVRFADYAIACVGMLPGTLLYVYLGKVAGDVAQLAGGAPDAAGGAQQVLLFVGLIATATVTVMVTRIARRALAEATGETDEGTAA